jgi:hypothetical protein
MLSANVGVGRHQGSDQNMADPGAIGSANGMVLVVLRVGCERLAAIWMPVDLLQRSPRCCLASERASGSHPDGTCGRAESPVGTGGRQPLATAFPELPEESAEKLLPSAADKPCCDWAAQAPTPPGWRPAKVFQRTLRCSASSGSWLRSETPSDPGSVRSWLIARLGPGLDRAESVFCVSLDQDSALHPASQGPEAALRIRPAIRSAQP